MRCAEVVLLVGVYVGGVRAGSQLGSVIVEGDSLAGVRAVDPKRPTHRRLRDSFACGLADFAGYQCVNHLRELEWP